MGMLMNALYSWIRKNMSAKDSRTKITSEVLKSILPIKMHAWESVVEDTLAGRRKTELQTVQGMAVANAWFICVFQGTPPLLMLAGFTVLIWKQQELKPDLVFAGIMLFTMLSSTLFELSSILPQMQTIKTSTKRISDYVKQPILNVTTTKQTKIQDLEETTVFEGVQIGWPGASHLITGGSFTVAFGKLTIICGGTATGKSTIMLSLLHYLETVERQSRKLRIAYSPQTPFLITGTLRENILFGQKFDAADYERVVDACCLGPDFKQLHKGDATEITGSIALSGGQKARICLARAAYSQADVYILDDPLSAVDVKVQRQITEKLFGRTGLLSRGTLVVASNNPLLLKEAESIYTVDEGEIHKRATPSIDSASATIEAVDSEREDTIEVCDSNKSAFSPNYFILFCFFFSSLFLVFVLFHL
jgi:ATP-binding cassette, subfamily C (CFTR/MRP), member 1